MTGANYWRMIMKIVDLNVLIYAVNRDSPLHQPLKRWWESAVNGDEPIGLPWAVLLGFLRLSTNPRVFQAPLSVSEALSTLDQWLSQPNVRILRETDGHWHTLRSLLVMSGTAGNLTTDAHLASLAISHGAVLVSCDADFARFAGLRWENPIANSN